VLDVKFQRFCDAALALKSGITLPADDNYRFYAEVANAVPERVACKLRPVDFQMNGRQYYEVGSKEGCLGQSSNNAFARFRQVLDQDGKVIDWAQSWQQRIPLEELTSDAKLWQVSFSRDMPVSKSSNNNFYQDNMQYRWAHYNLRLNLNVRQLEHLVWAGEAVTAGEVLFSLFLRSIASVVSTHCENPQFLLNSLSTGGVNQIYNHNGHNFDYAAVHVPSVCCASFRRHVKLQSCGLTSF
jgi:hypothetical protein